MIDYNKELNPQQREAVFHKDGSALVIAGAGTGKTRTLVYRVAHLVSQGVDPSRILLLTFTRRAANEMLERAVHILNDPRAKKVSGGTFHSFAHTVLRKHGAHIGIDPSFTILDRSDSEDILQHLRTEMGFAGKTRPGEKKRRFPTKRTLMAIISKARNTEAGLKEIVEQEWEHFLKETKGIQAVAKRYREYKRSHALLDYDDLLAALAVLLQKQPVLAGKLAEHFQFVLVDEYQDTNRVQARILKNLVQHGNIMAVGDDAQAIYSFRGASFRNIMEFQNDFPGATVYTIEENYRSTQPVLNAANEVIVQSVRQYQKKLFTTQKERGEQPRLVACVDEGSQAAYVADEILRLREEEVALEDIGVLFRSSYHSFELEAELARRNIPFVKYGGFKFAEAAHIKDAMAALRWLVNPKDLIAGQRVLSLISGVGAVTARRIADVVRETEQVVGGLKRVTPPARGETTFAALIRAYDSAVKQDDPASQLEAFAPFLETTVQERFDDYPRRMRDVEQLQIIASRFSGTEQFISEFSVDPPADDMVRDVSGVENEEEPLVLSTIHSAKGLEWHAVFVLSVLDGFLPQDYAFRSGEELEEERRLLYVAMTRAKELLTLTYPTVLASLRSPAKRSSGTWGKLSQFVRDVPEEVLPHVFLWDDSFEEPSAAGTGYLDFYLSTDNEDDETISYD